MSGWPHFDDEQIAAVTATMRSGKVNAWTGPDVRAFEQAYRDYTGAPYAIAMANGSVTLDTALHVLDLQPGDEVIVTPRSFVASASCILLAGGTPIFADVDPVTQNITPETIAPQIGPRTRGVIAVHLGGWPCDMARITALAESHGLWVIEDCAQAHGAMIGPRHVGTFGTFGSFSFCQDKILSTGGEGGMLLCHDAALWNRAWSFKDHGKSHARVHADDHPPGFRWLHSAAPGTNLRMTGLSAAIGRVQLTRLDDWRAHRTRNARILADTLAGSPVFRTPMPDAGITHAWYRFYSFIRPEALASDWSRDRILAEITARGHKAFSGSCSEMYREKVFTDRGLAPAAPLPVARELGETSLCFLVDPTVSPEDAQALADTVLQIGKAAEKSRGGKSAA